MAAINVRHLPEHVHRRLRLRAAANGRSMEAEVRALLAQACGADEEAAADPARSLPEWVDGLYGKRHPRGVVADLLRQRRREGRRE